jgi:hypothetical protein
MSYVSVPFADIRIPRVQKGSMGEAARRLCELFGLRAHVFAGHLDADTVAVIATHAEWATDGFVNEVFDRLADGTIAQLDLPHVAPVHLNPAEFVFVPRPPALVDEVLLYPALGIEYCIVVRNTGAASEKFIVPRGGMRHTLGCITRAVVPSGGMFSHIGNVTVEQVSIRTGRVADHGATQPLPSTVKFADIYTRPCHSIDALVRFFGARYCEVDLDRISVQLPRAAASRVVYALDGLGRTSAERVRAYCAMLRSADAMRSWTVAAYAPEEVTVAVERLAAATRTAARAVAALSEEDGPPEPGEVEPAARKRAFDEV